MAPTLRLDLWLCLAIAFLATTAVSASDKSMAASACSPELNLGSDEVAARLMSRNAERAQRLPHFDSVRSYELNYTGFPSGLKAEMVVKASFTPPATKEFTVVSESGSSLMRTRVLHRLLEAEQEAGSAANRDAMLLSTANYRFTLLGCEAGDTPLYVMRVEPLHKSKFLYRGTIWIDSRDFAVTRMEVEPAKSPSFWTARSQIRHQYQKIGEFYLPALNQTVTEVRLGGKAVLTIRYLDYKLATVGDRAGGTKTSQPKQPHRS